MNFGRFFKHIWRRIVHSKTPPFPPRLAMVKAMVMGLAHTLDQEMSCDEVYVLLDVFADIASRGEDAARLMPLVQHHLDMCPDCREEFLALLSSMQAIAASDSIA